MTRPITFIKLSIIPSVYLNFSMTKLRINVTVWYGTAEREREQANFMKTCTFFAPGYMEFKLYLLVIT